MTFDLDELATEFPLLKPLVFDWNRPVALGFLLAVDTVRREACNAVATIQLRAIAGQPSDATALRWLWGTAADLLLRYGVPVLEYEDWAPPNSLEKSYPSIFGTVQIAYFTEILEELK